MPNDSRLITGGYPIPSEGYADQPYVVLTKDGAWLCVMTTGRGEEGSAGQHIVARRSTDQGKTWSDPIAIEPSDGPEASYAVLLACPSGRIYCFYNHNTDQVRSILAEDGITAHSRVDSLGHYVFKFSDDGGRTWSNRRYDVPIRKFACDIHNIYGGKICFFWNVGRPSLDGQRAYLTLHKVGAIGEGFFAASEGAILCSDNLTTELDPEKIRFQTLPDGDIGLKAPAGGGRVAEEQSLAVLSDGSLYCVYRSTDGWPVCSYSRDMGHTWSPPVYKTYTPGGKRFKHPRAANFAWRCNNGKYLYWFHNHGGAAVKRDPIWNPYSDRNPVWLAAGREIKTPEGLMLEWSQPEIALYDHDPQIRISYPDLVEDGGRYFLTETQKTIGRTHEIDLQLLEGLFNQWDNRSAIETDVLMNLADTQGLSGSHSFPRLPMLAEPDPRNLYTGFAVDFQIRLSDTTTEQIALDTRNINGAGLYLTITRDGAVMAALGDGQQTSVACFDPGLITAGKQHYVSIIVDGGPKIITCIVDGVLCDGGDHKQFGWQRFSPTLQSANGMYTAELAPNLHGSLTTLKVYGRALRTSEAVGNWRASQNINTINDKKG